MDTTVVTALKGQKDLPLSYAVLAAVPINYKALSWSLANKFLI